MKNSFNIIICSNAESQVKKSIEYLEEKNYGVFFIKNEEELHSRMTEEEIHLVIIELDFKPKDGITITSDIRNQKNITQPYIIIFSNKQDDYIQITAFNSGADDFIVTPIKPILLEARISTLKKRLLSKTAEIIPEKDSDKYQFLKNTLTQANPFNRIILTTMEGYYPVKIEEIIYCKADDSYTHFFLPDGKHHIVSKQLKEYEDLLEHHNFFRIHKSFLINLNHIEKILKADGTSVVMSNKDELPVSLRKKDEFIFKLRS